MKFSFKKLSKKKKKRLIIGIICLLIIVLITSIYIFRPKEKPIVLLDLIELEEPTGKQKWFFEWLPKNREEVVKMFGLPDEIKVKNIKNQHDPSITDVIYQLKYDGLEAVVYKASYDKREFLIGLTVSDSRYPVSKGLNIGDPFDVEKMLGRPAKIKKTAYVYYATMEMNDEVNLHFESDKIAKIEWLLYFD